MRVLWFLFALALPCAATELRSLQTLLEVLRTKPSQRGAALAGINGILRPWLDDVIRQHGYSPGAETLASKLNTDLLARIPEANCRSPKGWPCLGEIRVMDFRQPYFMVVKTSVSFACSYEEAAYLYEWSRARWKLRMALDEEPTQSGPPRRFETFDLSGADVNNRRMLASVAVRKDCSQDETGEAEMRVYALEDRSNRQLVSSTRWAVLNAEPIQVSVDQTTARFELTVESLDPELGTRVAIQTYRLTAKEGARVQPVARSPRSFVEEWLTSPWPEAAAWSDGDRLLKGIHDGLFGEAPSGEFLRTASCDEPRTFQVAIRNYEVRSGLDVKNVPELYFKVVSSEPGTYLILDAADAPYDGCEQ